MSGSAQRGVRESPAQGFAAQAASGSAWTTAQTVANKFVTVFAMLAIARFLSPAELGLANLAVSIGAFCFIFAPFVMGDVLIAESKRFDALSGVAGRLSWAAGWTMFAIVAAIAVPIERWKGEAGLAFLVGVTALRPLADAVLVVAFARARIDLDYRRIARTDGLINRLATLFSVSMAWLGAGPVSVTLPPIAALAVRGWIYRRDYHGRLDHTVHAEYRAEIGRKFAVASIGQYANNVLMVLEVLVLGMFATKAEIGFFGLAFQLAVQANTIIAAQLGAVLQPIFGHIQEDPARQIGAFVRATRLLSAVAVPMSVMQAALAIPAFAVLFEAKWTGAIAPFVALSLAQSFVFVTAPAIALLKAQGRFTVYLAWQFGQLGIATIVFLCATAWEWGGGMSLEMATACGIPTDADGGRSLAIAVASAVVWAASCPIAVFLAGRPAHLGKRTTLGIFFQPWIIAGPCALLMVFAWVRLRIALPMMWADLLTLLVVGPAFLLVAILGCVWSRHDSREDFRRVIGRFRRRGS